MQSLEMYNHIFRLMEHGVFLVENPQDGDGEEKINLTNWKNPFLVLGPDRTEHYTVTVI